MINKSFLRSLMHALVVGVLMSVISLFFSDMYISEASLLPSPQKGSINGGLLAVAEGMTGDVFPELDDEMILYENILRSRWLAEQVLADKYIFNTRRGYFGKPIRCDTTLLAYLGVKNIDQGVAALKGIIKIRRDTKRNVVYVSATTRSPELSQGLVQKAVGFLAIYLDKKNITRGSVKAKFARERLQEKKRELLEAETRLREFAERNRAYDNSPDPSVRLLGARLESELNFSRSIVGNAGQSYERALLESKGQPQGPNILDSANIPTEKSGPKRSVFVFVSMFIAWLLSWSYQNRQQLITKLMVD